LDPDDAEGSFKNDEDTRRGHDRPVGDWRNPIGKIAEIKTGRRAFEDELQALNKKRSTCVPTVSQ
jgi:hypothetical protein